MVGTRVVQSSPCDAVSCSECSTAIGSADYTIVCDYCNLCFHHRCVGFSDSAFHSFSKLNTPGLAIFHCDACKVTVANLSKSTDYRPSSESTDNRLDKLETQLNSISATLGLLTGQVDASDTPPPSSAPSYASVAKRGTTSNGRVVTVSDLHRINEEESHRRGIVVAGMAELGKDMEDVTALCRFLDPSASVVQVFRMGRLVQPTGDAIPRPRLLKVHLPSSSVAKSLLGLSKRLEESLIFKGVFIRRSMTVQERQELAKVRERCKQLNDTKESDDVKYVVIGEQLARFTKCKILDDGHLVGGVRDRSWSVNTDNLSATTAAANSNSDLNLTRE